MKEELSHARAWTSIPAILVILVGFGATAATSAQFYRVAQGDIDARVITAAREIAVTIEAEIDQQANVLRGVRALYAASSGVSREEFSAYVSNAETLRATAGLSAVGVTPRVAADDVDDYAAVLRQLARGYGADNPSVELADQPEVFPQPLDHPEAFVVSFIEPIDRNARALGFDVGSERNRREALEQARDRDAPVASAPISLVQDDVERPSLLIFLPLYEEGTRPRTAPARRRSLVGFTTSVVRTDALLENVLARRSDVAVDVYDVGPVADFDSADIEGGERLYGEGPRDMAHARAIDINAAGRRWRAVVWPGPDFVAGSRAWQVALAVGSLATLALLLFVRRERQTIERTRRLVRERTRELEATNAQLRAEEEAKSEFVSTVSHELRTPVAAITGFTSLLARDLGPEASARTRDLVARVERSADHLVSLVEDVLDFSRLDRGQSMYTTAPVDLGLLVADTIDQLASVQDASTITRDLADDVIVLAHPQAVTRIVSNLVMNAVKYAGENAVVDVAVAADGTLIVADNGPGIPLEERDAVFERFVRGSTAGGTSGTGIGLAVTRELAELFGGSIHIDDAPEGGARFVVSLRLAASKAGRA